MTGSGLGLYCSENHMAKLVYRDLQYILHKYIICIMIDKPSTSARSLSTGFPAVRPVMLGAVTVVESHRASLPWPLILPLFNTTAQPHCIL
jgi:hypothetical protein